MKNHFNSTSAQNLLDTTHTQKRANFFFYLELVPKRNSESIPGVNINNNGDIVSYSIREQCIAVFENVQLVLKDSGAEWDDIIDVTVLTNMKDDFKVFKSFIKVF